MFRGHHPNFLSRISIMALPIRVDTSPQAPESIAKAWAQATLAKFLRNLERAVVVQL